MEIRFRLTRKRVTLFVGVVALIAAGAAVAVASNAYTDANGVYHGCVGTDSGVLRVLASGQSCRLNEAAIDWNQVGPKGDAGPQGEQGDQGIQGIQGLTGDKGDKGDQGIQGIQGIQGAKGDKGDQGIQGIQGLKGDKGDKGDTGSPGPAGSLSVTNVIGPYVGACSTGDPTFCSNVASSTATCPDGQVLTGGGYSVWGSGVRVFYNSSGAGDNAWHVGIVNDSAISGGSVTATAECLRLS